MAHLKKNAGHQVLQWQNPEHRLILSKLLHADNIAITSTDTVFGFLANLSVHAYNTLNLLKGRSPDKPYLILIGSLEKLTHFVAPANVTPEVTKFLQQCWPGPLTVIFKANPQLAHHLTSQNGTVALRYPHHHGLQEILTSFDGLFSTSANKSGHDVPNRLEDIDEDIVQQCTYVMTDTTTPQQTTASSIIDLTDIYSPKIVRTGAYDLEKLEKLYGKPFRR